ncbi:hypothetical protein LTR53_012472 [Teratosphaeriaceae sp. CCFEE 6253]|nr:hypothetical protein LTR53_012472 [Teratosphaeriaceae sp. CCFEE 6253]
MANPIPSSSKTPFREVPEGRGGTFPVHHGPAPPPDSSRPTPRANLHHIGTAGLWACAGIYCALPHSRSFVAHIQAYALEPGGDPVRHARFSVSAEHGAELKQRVLDRLHAHAGEQGWDPLDAGVRESLRIACPCPVDANRGLKRTGWYVAEAVREFFGAPEAVLEVRSGFVVDRRTGEVEWLSYDDDIRSVRWECPELRRYEGVREEEAEIWAFVKTLKAEGTAHGDAALCIAASLAL